MFSEFLLIAAWTWFKTQDDYFSVYNNVDVQKFSIFQRYSKSRKEKDDEEEKRETEVGRDYSDSLISNHEDDSRKKFSFDKRSI